MARSSKITLISTTNIRFAIILIKTTFTVRDSIRTSIYQNERASKARTTVIDKVAVSGNALNHSYLIHTNVFRVIWECRHHFALSIMLSVKSNQFEFSLYSLTPCTVLYIQYITARILIHTTRARCVYISHLSRNSFTSRACVRACAPSLCVCRVHIEIEAYQSDRNNIRDDSCRCRSWCIPWSTNFIASSRWCWSQLLFCLLQLYNAVMARRQWRRFKQKKHSVATTTTVMRAHHRYHWTKVRSQKRTARASVVSFCVCVCVLLVDSLKVILEHIRRTYFELCTVQD